MLPPALRNISKPSAGYIYINMKFKAALSFVFTYAIHIRTSPSPYRQTYNIYLPIGEGAEVLHQDFFQNGEVRDKHSR